MTSCETKTVRWSFENGDSSPLAPSRLFRSWFEDEEEDDDDVEGERERRLLRLPLPFDPRLPSARPDPLRLPEPLR